MVGTRSGAPPLWQQEPAGHEHEHGAECRQREPDRRDGEESEPGPPGLLQRGGGDEERRCADDGDRRTERGRERERHQQRGGRNPLVVGEIERDRQHHRRGGDVMCERRQHRHRRHDDGDCARPAVAGPAADQTPESLGDARVMERRAQHEDRRHHDGGLAAESGQGLRGLQEAGQGQRDDDQHRDHVVPKLLGDEQDERREKNRKEDELRRRQATHGWSIKHAPCHCATTGFSLTHRRRAT